MRTLLPFIVIAWAGCYSGTASDSKSDAGSVCDDKGDCAQCLDCANANPCAQQLDACANNSYCVGLSECINGCGPDMSCQQQCATGNSQGIPLYNALRDCQYCEQCPSDCAGYRDCS